MLNVYLKWSPKRVPDFTLLIICNIFSVIELVIRAYKFFNVCIRNGFTVLCYQPVRPFHTGYSIFFIQIKLAQANLPFKNNFGPLCFIRARECAFYHF